MTLEQWSQLITALAAAIAAVLGALNRSQLGVQQAKIEQIHVATNSMKDELVAAVKSEATAAGIATGKAEQKADQKIADLRQR